MRARHQCATIATALALLPALASPAFAAEQPRANWSGAFSGSLREQTWTPEKAAGGAVVLLMAKGESRVVVLRDGVMIGSAACAAEAQATAAAAGPLMVLDRRTGAIVPPLQAAGAGDPLYQQPIGSGSAAHRRPAGRRDEPRVCSRLPAALAASLTDVAAPWMPVAVVPTAAVAEVVIGVGAASSAADAAQPSLPLAYEHLTAGGGLAPQGPVAVVVAAADRMAYVVRDGSVVAAVRIAIRNPLRPLGEAAFGLLGPGRDGRGARWLSTTPPDRDRGSLLELLGRVEFLELGKLREAIPGLSPGTLLVFTDQSTASLPPVVQRRVVTTSGEDRGMGAKAQTKPSSRPVGPATPRPARRKPVRERYPVPETVPNSV